MAGKYIIALDQGTTSSRTMLIDRQGNPVGSVQREFPQIYPKPGWVDHDPKDIVATQLGTFTELLKNAGYPEDYLEPIYTCPKCNDKGTHDGKWCSCFLMSMVQTASL